MFPNRFQQGQQPGQRPGFPQQPPPGAPAQPQFPGAPGRPAGPPAQQFQQPAQPTFRQQPPAFRGAPQGGAARPQMPAMNSNPFAGIQQARARQDANYETDGSYIEKINVVKHKVGQDRLNLVIVEKTVLAVLAQSETGRTHTVGEIVTHLIKEDLRYNYFLPEVKAMISAVIGCPDEAVTDEMCWEICNEQANPLGGLVVEMQNRPKMTGGGKLITIRNYKRRIRTTEIQQTLPPEVVARFFPGDTLVRMAAAEAEEAAQQQAFEQSEQQAVPHMTAGTAPYGQQQPQPFAPTAQHHLPPPPQQGGYYPPQQ